MQQTPPRRTRWLLFALLIVMGSAVAIPDRNSITTFHETNAAVRLYQLQAIDSYQSFSIEHVLCRWGPFHSTLDLSIDESARPYPNKAPGVTALSLPAYLLLKGPDDQKPPFHWLLTMLALVMGLVPLLIAGGLWAHHIEGLLGRGYGFAMAAILVLASPLFVLSGLFQDYALATALFMGGFFLLRTRQSLGGRCGGGLLLGLAGACNYMYFVYGFIVGIFFILERRERRSGALIAAIPILGGALLPLACVLAYHHAIWGDMFTTPYEHLHSAFLRRGPAETSFSAIVLLETLFHGKLGMFFTTPWSIAGIVGLGVMVKHQNTRWFALPACAVVLTNWLFCLYWLGSNPDMGAFNRHMAVSYFFLAVGSVYLLRAVAYDPAWRNWFPAFLFSAVVVAVLYQWVTSWTYPYHDAALSSPIWSVNIPFFVMGMHLKPLHLDSSMRLGTGSADGNWEWVLLSCVFLIVAFILVRIQFGSQKTSVRIRMTRLLAGVLTFIILTLWGMSSITVSKGEQDAPPTTAQFIEMRSFDNATNDLVGSYFIPDGATWNQKGYATNRWCQFAVCIEKNDPERCKPWVIRKSRK